MATSSNTSPVSPVAKSFHCRPSPKIRRTDWRRRAGAHPETATAWPSLEAARAALAGGTGEGIRIAVLDSGVATAHPDLSGLMLEDDLAMVEGGLALATMPGGGRDVFGHGTTVAGILRELAPAARIGSFGCAREDHVLLFKDWLDEAYVRGRQIVAASNNQDFTRREWPGHFPTILTVPFTHAARPDALFRRARPGC